MKQVLLLILLSLELVSYSQNIGKIITPKVWLRSDLIEDETNLWEDHSGNGYNAISSDSSVLNTNGLINFNKAVSFGGSGFDMGIPYNLSQASQLTIITVYNTNDNSKESAIWSATVDLDQQSCLSTQKLSSPESIAKYSEENINLPVVNTSSQYFGNPGEEVEGASILLGGLKNDTSDISNFSGDIAEFIVFNHLLGVAENQLIQSYLAIKYGTTFQLSDYITSKGNVVWDYQNYSEYSYAIAGLGRDDGFELYQKQSSNAEEAGLLTVGLESISVSNDENLSTLKNDNYIIWGMNDQEPTPELSDEELYPYKYPVMQRKWRMQVTGNEAYSLPTMLQFDVKESIGESSICYLIIDRTGLGDFTLSEIEYIQADSITSNGIACFSNIVWDNDKSGSDIFTLTYGMDNGVTCTHPLCHNDPTGAIQMQVMGGNAPYTYSLSNDSLSYSKYWTSESRFQEIEDLASGEYKLSVTDHDGSIATNTITINNAEAFSTGLDSIYTLKMGDQLVLDGGTNVSMSETSFIWEDVNGLLSTDSEISIVQPGTYTLTLENKEGCQVAETIKVNALNDILFNYKLYPNPTAGNYTLNIALAEQLPVKVSIYNMQGALINKETRDGAAIYSLNAYLEKAGLYFVVIETSYGKETFKLVVKQ